MIKTICYMTVKKMLFTISSKCIVKCAISEYPFKRWDSRQGTAQGWRQIFSGHLHWYVALSLSKQRTSRLWNELFQTCPKPTKTIDYMTKDGTEENLKKIHLHCYYITYTPLVNAVKDDSSETGCEGWKMLFFVRDFFPKATTWLAW